MWSELFLSFYFINHVYLYVCVFTCVLRLHNTHVAIREQLLEVQSSFHHARPVMRTGVRASTR